MKLRNIGVTVAFSALILAPVSSFADTTTAATTTTKVPNQQKVEQRCQAAETRFTNRSNKVIARIEKREALYDKEDSKVQALLQKAKDQGADTTKAQTDLATWKDKTTQLKTARQTLADQLKSAAQADCSTATKGQFKTDRDAAKAQLAKIAGIHTDKQNFFKNTLKPDLKAIRDQLKQKH